MQSAARCAHIYANVSISKAPYIKQALWIDRHVKLAQQICQGVRLPQCFFVPLHGILLFRRRFSIIICWCPLRLFCKHFEDIRLSPFFLSLPLPLPLPLFLALFSSSKAFEISIAVEWHFLASGMSVGVTSGFKISSEGSKYQRRTDTGKVHLSMAIF